MLKDLIGYYIVAVLAIWIAQVFVNGFVSVGERRLQKRLAAFLDDPGAQERAAPFLDAFLRRNSILRITVRVVVLLFLAAGAWAIAYDLGGWWWAPWLMFAYNLFGAIYTLPQDILCITQPATVREGLH